MRLVLEYGLAQGSEGKVMVSSGRHWCQAVCSPAGVAGGGRGLQGCEDISARTAARRWSGLMRQPADQGCGLRQ